MSKEQNNEKENKALHIADVSKLIGNTFWIM
jgi:hypothetical protein